jgi:hypothetical protein
MGKRLVQTASLEVAPSFFSFRGSSTVLRRMIGALWIKLVLGCARGELEMGGEAIGVKRWCGEVPYL